MERRKTNRFIVTALLLLASSVTYGQTECTPFIPTTVGTVWELSNYSAKGKENGKIQYELLDKVESGNGITFTFKTLTYDQKGEKVFESTSDATCADGKFEFDMTYKMDGSAMEAYQDMEMDVDASEFYIPDMDAAIGTTLPDGTLKIGMTGAMPINMTVFVTDRKIESKERIETPAGSFDCLVLSQNISTKMVVSVKGASKEWYAEEVGLVRSESYNKKGKLMGYSELTSLQVK